MKGKKGLAIKDLLEIKTGELLAKTEELKEAADALRLSHLDATKRITELRKTKKDLSDVEHNLVVTTDKLAESNQKLIEMNDELIETNKNLIMANEQIKDLTMNQKEFIDVAAHELRTPTQAILGYSDLLLLSAQQTNVGYIKLIMKNANRIKRLISNILDMARIDNLALKLHKELFSLPDLISTVVYDFRNQIKINKKNLDIIFDTVSSSFEEKNKDIIIKADKDRIAQVLNNLVENAVNSTDNGKIVITIALNQKNTDSENPNHRKEIIVKIKDSGKGLDANLYARVFSKFFTTSEGSGTGLGLYICKAIIEAHEGNIWIESNKDKKGISLLFSLPSSD